MKTLLKGLIHLYRWTLSPLLGNCCRFHPSCSTYGLDALEKHGPLKGGLLILKRLIKCGPWHPGGVDEVPEKKT